jgi:hypothetical protein
MKEMRKAHPLLDALRQENKLRSDSHLAEELGQRKYGWSIKKIDALLAKE